MWKLSKYEAVLAAGFLFTLPLLRPWIHGDGRGYYAYARAILLQHNLDFELDWEKGYEASPKYHEPGFRQNYLTPNGHIDNHYTIGPAILWTPFMLCGGAAAQLIDKVAHTSLAGDGFSRPYVLSMALGTYFYGFLALLFSMRLARRYFDERWAFLATAAIWLASSFTFYLYAEPAFSHIPSAFLVALFLLLWDRTRHGRTWSQWMALGAVGGLMMNTYYPNALVLLLPLFDTSLGLWSNLKQHDSSRFKSLLVGNLAFATTALAVFVPSLLTKKILYGSYIHTGYKQSWYWNSPAFFRAGFSSHGAFSWTPVLIPAAIGLFLLRRANRGLSNVFLVIVFAFFYLVGCYQDWHAIPSFGNRIFISLTPFFILGLAACIASLSNVWSTQRIWISAQIVTAFLILWNFGLMYQFAAHLFPQDSEVSWTNVVYNQAIVLPSEAGRFVKNIVAGKGSAEPARSSSAPEPETNTKVERQ